MSALRWTLKSTYQLAEDLTGRGFKASAETVRRLLHQMGYSLQAPAKQNEGATHPDRDGQFNYLNKIVSTQINVGEPVISVDTKKKELIGEYANVGAEWHPKGEPTRVSTHDFADRSLGDHSKAIPYGVYDIGNDEGWVSVGDTADTAEFAVESIRRWWNMLGKTRFLAATTLTITADGGVTTLTTGTANGTTPSRPNRADSPAAGPNRSAQPIRTARERGSGCVRATGKPLPSPQEASS
jgi:Rhodopirellula transposase DDE domain